MEGSGGADEQEGFAENWMMARDANDPAVQQQMMQMDPNMQMQIDPNLMAQMTDEQIQ